MTRRVRAGMKRIAFVVATKDRPDDLRTMLQSVSAQSHCPDRIIIVDASSPPIRGVVREFSDLPIQYIYHKKPSASAQRNAGIRAVDIGIDLIAFFDDDIVLGPDALENMLRFWHTSPDHLGGCAFNVMDSSSTISRVKGSALSRWLGLYADRKYAVMPSGWQTRAGTVAETNYVEWLPTGASVWRREIFDYFSFDEFFDGYSYLEDLDFSYTVSKRWRLAVIADACYWHFPSRSGRESAYRFGKSEVRNRLYIVRKHKLSLWRCYIGIAIRLCMTLVVAVQTRRPEVFQRALGNFWGIMQSLLQRNEWHVIRI